MIEMFHGDPLAAIKWNPLAVLAFVCLVLFDLYAAIVLVSRTARLRIVDWSISQRLAARIAVVGLFILNWAYLLMHRGRF